MACHPWAPCPTPDQADLLLTVAVNNATRLGELQQLEFGRRMGNGQQLSIDMPEAGGHVAQELVRMGGDGGVPVGAGVPLGGWGPRVGLRGDVTISPQLALVERTCCGTCPCTCVGLPGLRGPSGPLGSKVKPRGCPALRDAFGLDLFPFVGGAQSPAPIPFPGPPGALGAGINSGPCPIRSQATAPRSSPLPPPAGNGAQELWLPARGPSWSRGGWGGRGCCPRGLSVLGGGRQQGTCWRRRRARAQCESAVGPPGRGTGWSGGARGCCEHILWPGTPSF